LRRKNRAGPAFSLLAKLFALHIHFQLHTMWSVRKRVHNARNIRDAPVYRLMKKPAAYDDGYVVAIVVADLAFEGAAAPEFGRASQRAVQQLEARFQPVDRRLRRTITFDNGTGLARHQALATELGIRPFFCAPYSPWQKGSVAPSLRSRAKKRAPVGPVSFERVAS
jgi:hypothetical protein